MVKRICIAQRMFAMLLVAVMSGGAAAAQSQALALGSASTVAGGTAAVDMTLNAAGAAPAAVQWRLSYLTSPISAINFTAGPAAIAAGKTLLCSYNPGWADCVLYGDNAATMANGVIATATITTVAGSAAQSVALTLANPGGSDAGGNGIPSTATSGALSILPPPPSTWSLSGAVSSGGGATITLSGAASRTVTADASGNYSFTGLANGSYTVTPSKAGFTITPATRSMTIGGANVSAVNFTAVQPSWSLSGTITSGGGASVTLSGTASRTVTADASGAYSFTGLPNGSYTVTPSKTGFSFAPANRSTAINGANVAALDFTASQNGGSAPTLDSSISRDYSHATSAFTAPALSTHKGTELLLAFISMDAGVSGAETVRSVVSNGLSWTLVRRTNQVNGSAEIWRAFAPQALSNYTVTANLSQRVVGSLTVMSFSGVDTGGLNGASAIGATAGSWSSRGTPAAALVTTRMNSLVLGVGSDSRNGFDPVPASGQSLVHPFSGAGMGTYWVQKMNQAVPAAGTMTTILDSYPTWSAYNLSIVEVRGPAATAAADILSNAARPLSSAAGTVPSGIASSDAVLANAATGEPGQACSPGGWAVILGQGFTSQPAQNATTPVLPLRLGGMHIEINGHAAPLLTAANEQVTFQCPLLPADTPLEMTVVAESGEAFAVDGGKMQASVPALFTWTGTNRGIAQITSSNQMVLPEETLGNTRRGAAGEPAGRPVLPGEYLRIFPSGLGETELALPSGTPAPLDRVVRLIHRVSVVVGGRELQPVFAGLAPGTAGLFQVDFAIPPDTAPGAEVPLSLKIRLADGSERISNLVTLAIGAPRID